MPSAWASAWDGFNCDERNAYSLALNAEVGGTQRRDTEHDPRFVFPFDNACLSLFIGYLPENCRLRGWGRPCSIVDSDPAASQPLFVIQGEGELLQCYNFDHPDLQPYDCLELNCFPLDTGKPKPDPVVVDALLAKPGT